MNILYGICGDGMGHVTRSLVLGERLESLGHRVNYASSGRALQVLRKKKSQRVIPLLGLETVVIDNRVDPIGTVLKNGLRHATGLWTHVRQATMFASCAPNVVITDYEPWTSMFALTMGKPLIAVDNVHFLNRCAHPESIFRNDYDSFVTMGAVCGAIVPSAHRYLVTTFAAAPVVAHSTELHLPILRQSVLSAKADACSGEHLLAYFNGSASHEPLVAAMSALGVPVKMYGVPGLTRRKQLGNVRLEPFSERGLVSDMATARAVIGGSGFTFMTEAIYLGKPMLALPFEGQFEQILNAEYLQRLGYGERARQLDIETIGSFLERAPEYAVRLRNFRHDGNDGLFAAVERHMGDLAA